MPYTVGLRWKIYLFIFTPLALGNFVSILDGESAVYSYYHALIAFHPDYFLQYAMNVASATLNAFALIPLFLYTFRGSFLWPRFWQWFFILRIAFDLTGHAYEAKLVKSLFISHSGYAISSLLLLLLLVVPSYIACFRYAFRQDRLFPQAK